MTFPVRYMAVRELNGGIYFGKVIDTKDDSLPLCMCFIFEDAYNIARAMNEAEGYTTLESYTKDTQCQQ